VPQIVEISKRNAFSALIRGFPVRSLSIGHVRRIGAWLKICPRWPAKLTPPRLAARLRQMRPDMAIVERVASRPGQGVCSVFKFGASYGCMRGVLAAREIQTYLVTPQTWKKHFRLDSDKEKSRGLALRLFPKTPEHFARKRDHGKAEASLIALFGAQSFAELQASRKHGHVAELNLKQEK
jgi:crossover junction endodeoxyribonuclease RuvC